MPLWQTWLKALGAFVAPLLSAALSSVLGALRTKRLDQERDQLNRSDARNEAALETQQAINETAEQISSVPDSPTDADELVGELRAERSGVGGSGASREQRPF